MKKRALLSNLSHRQALTQAMNTLMNNDALSAAMGKAARERYEKLFSGPALGGAYADLFREIANC